jgi:hypothetical protein
MELAQDHVRCFKGVVPSGSGTEKLIRVIDYHG